MIDTIRLKIPIDPLIFIAMKESLCFIPNKSVKEEETESENQVENEASKTEDNDDLGEDTLDRKLLTYREEVDINGYISKSLFGFLIIPDYHGTVRLWVSNKNADHNLFVEFSIPKLVFGHNIDLFYPNDLEEVLFKIQVEIEKRFGITLMSFEEWVIQRIDLCYVWKFATHQIAQNMLMSLRPFEYPRKEESVYSSGIAYKGTSSSIKFYLKKEEFQKKDYSKKGNVSESYAKKLLSLAEGCLRFEVEYKKAKLYSLFNKKELHPQDFTKEFKIIKLLRKELKIVTKGISPKVMQEQEMIEKLTVTYGLKQGLALFQFYVAFCDPVSKQVLKTKLSKSTINKKLAQITEAHVGMFSKVKELKAALMIPSPLVINSSNAQALELVISEVEAVPADLEVHPPLISRF